MQSGFTEVYETYNPILASLIKAKLTDEDIPFVVSGDTSLADTIRTFDSKLTRIALKLPIKFFVPEAFTEAAKTAINTDRSGMISDDLEY